MKNLVILGAGTAGTTLANKLRPVLNQDEWRIRIVDQAKTHYYQPGFLFIPFGIYGPEDVQKPRDQFLPDGVDLIYAPIDQVDPQENRVYLGDNRGILSYDYLIIATGTHPRPDETPGLLDEGWYETAFDFYSFEGSVALADRLKDWPGGQLVVNVMEMPIKCPIAPLEFVFLADWYFQEKGLRDKVDITYVTPLPGAFTKPTASHLLTKMLAEKNIRVVPEFYPERVDGAARKLIAFDETEVDYDLLVTIPVNMGAEYVGRSGLGDELNHVPVDKHTFLSKEYDNIFALGDAAALPTSKAGSVAHFAIEVFVENFMRYIAGETMEPSFDGHANCFLETGFGKGLLLDFNYDVEPLPGKFPLPAVGPFTLLEESKANHMGKLAFRWFYWNVLLKGRPFPIPAQMMMAGKKPELAFA